MMLAPAQSKASWVASVLGLCAALLAIAGAILTAISWSDLKPADQYAAYALPVATVVYAALGLFIIRRVGNRIGWLLLAEGSGIGLLCVTSIYAVIGVVSHPALPAAKAVGASSELIFVPISIGIIYMLLIFPTGTLPSRRWRPIAALMMIVAALSLVGFTVSPRQVALPAPGGVSVMYPNPFAIESLSHGVSTMMLGTLSSLTLVSALLLVAAAIALVVRYRSGGRDLRLQIKWMALATVAWVAFQAALALAQTATGTDSALTLVVGLASALVALILIPVAIAGAILKHRLYDVDVVINKAVVFGALAAFITAVYVAIVVGIGALVGSGSKPNFGLSILATALVAVGFQPVRERIQRLANRLVYGNRASPYEVLSEFSDRVAETYATEDVLPRMARAISEGTGAARSEVWLRSDGELKIAASWPEDGASISGSRMLVDGELPAGFDGVDRVVGVRHHGDLLGALALTKRSGETLTQAEDKLLSDLASQAGLVLRNVALTSELLARLEELRASRQRLVAAQDQERRRLERNLHDGAQQHLVALRTRLSLAKRMTERDATKAAELLTQLEADADEALETLRDLARGIYPPLLADQGLEAALEAQARKAVVPVEVQARNITRYPQEIEAAVYFCSLEALQNVAKYAGASRATVTLEQRDSQLTFSVADDGKGFDVKTAKRGSGTQNMSDRLEALGGSLTLDSAAGQGTTVRGHLPVEALERS